MSTYAFPTLYTILHHNLIKETLIYLNERTFQREDAPYIASNDRNAFFTSQEHKMYTLWSCQEVSEAYTFLLDNINIRFGTDLYIQIVSIPTGSNCALLVADLFLFCYERDFMMPFSGDQETEIIQAFISTSRYLDDLLYIDNTYFDGMVNHFTNSELQLNEANSSGTEAPFLDSHLTISESFVSSTIYIATIRGRGRGQVLRSLGCGADGCRFESRFLHLQQLVVV